MKFRIGEKFEGTHGGQHTAPHQSTYPVRGITEDDNKVELQETVLFDFYFILVVCARRFLLFLLPELPYYLIPEVLYLFLRGYGGILKYL